MEAAANWIMFSWDFYGHQGAGTAQHFRIHLEQFLRREKLECTTGVDKYSPIHHSCWVKASVSAQHSIRDSLRPMREAVCSAPDDLSLDV